jgi:hypothetical protein
MFHGLSYAKSKAGKYALHSMKPPLSTITSKALFLSQYKHNDQVLTGFYEPPTTFLYD